jgi:hypothetical protein
VIQLAVLLQSALALLVFFTSSMAAQSDAGELKGLQAVGVTIEDLDVGARNVGLTREQLQTNVELKLRLAGLRVAQNDASAPPSPFVYVQIVTFGVDDLHFYVADIKLEEPVRILRNGRSTLASTWTKGGYGSATSAALHDAILQDVANRTDEFLNSWVAANPR